MDPFETLLEAIEAYSDAKAQYKAASENVRYDRGYFCARENQAVISAKKRLKEALDGYISRVVATKEVG